tara:strand:- start:2986 stop:3513 length:528 start_codon:yes stop_codon:yes gene_type:complete
MADTSIEIHTDGIFGDSVTKENFKMLCLCILYGVLEEFENGRKKWKLNDFPEQKTQETKRLLETRKGRGQVLINCLKRLFEKQNEIHDLKAELEKAMKDNLSLDSKINQLNGAHKSEIDRLKAAHKSEIEATELAFAKAAENTWDYETMASAPALEQAFMAKKITTRPLKNRYCL